MLDMRTIMDRLEMSEGLVTTRQPCPAGKMTIGYGRNIDDNPLDAEEQRHLGCGPKGPNPISKKDAEYLLQSDINKCINDLDKRFPWWKNLDGEHQFIMIDMAFNCGIGGLSKHKTMLQCMKEGKFDEAAEAMRNTKYFRQVGNRSARNYVLMRTGVYNKNVTQRTMGNYLSGNITSAPAPSSSGSYAYASAQTSSASNSSQKTRNTLKADQKRYKDAKAKADTKALKAKKKAEKQAAKAAKAKQREDDDKKQMTKMIDELNRNVKDPKDKIDTKKAVDTLYKAHGKKAVKKLQNTINKPKKGQTPHSAVKKLLTEAEKKITNKKSKPVNKAKKSNVAQKDSTALVAKKKVARSR
jgi:lysozyme